MASSVSVHNTARFAAGLLALLLHLASAAAQQDPAAAPDDAARAASARALFEDGMGFADRAHWQEAADRFGRALELRDSPVIAYNLALALDQLGQLIKASELLRRVQVGAGADVALRTSADDLLVQIETRIGRLTVHAEDRQAGDRVLIDDRTLLDAELDVPIPIDPGAHVVRAERGGQVLDSQQVGVAPGTSHELMLHLTPAPPPRAVAVAAIDASRDDAVTAADDDGGAITGTWWFWAGVGTAAAGAAVVAALLASSGGGSERRDPVAGDFDPPVIGVEVSR